MIKKKKMTIEDLAVKIDDVQTKMGGLATHVDEKIDESVGNLAIMVQKGFAETAKQEDLLALTDRVKLIEERLDGHDKEFRGMHQNFDMIFQELKAIRQEMKEADTRADVVDLQLRVAKLEKKIRP
ncbi:MAG TPA: hypothetical protein VMA75_01640 [Candidatus Paceibacterota bacterium]|nr:hypothetical protein [Candidatus Paceibacterota bacterium]